MSVNVFPKITLNYVFYVQLILHALSGMRFSLMLELSLVHAHFVVFYCGMIKVMFNLSGSFHHHTIWYMIALVPWKQTCQIWVNKQYQLAKNEKKTSLQDMAKKLHIFCVTYCVKSSPWFVTHIQLRNAPKWLGEIISIQYPCNPQFLCSKCSLLGVTTRHH